METDNISTEHTIVIDVEAARINARGRTEGRIPCPNCHHTHSPAKRNNRDMTVNLSTGGYKCHRCELKGYVKGDGYDFTAPNRELLRFVRREKVACDFPPIPALPWDYDKTAEENWAAISAASTGSAFSPDVAAWLKSRRLRPSTLRNFDVRCEGYKLHAPTRRAYNIINVETRDTRTKRFFNVADAPMLVYNLDEMLRPFHDDAPFGEGYLAYDTMIIVEGRADVWAAAEAGYYNVVSVPNGATASVESYINKDMDVQQVLQGLSKVILAVDSDEEGRQLRQKLIEAIGAGKCWTVEYPEDCKDLGDVLRLHETKKIVQVLSSTSPVPHAVSQQSGADTDSSNSCFVNDTFSPTWPTLDREKALYGLAGEIVKAIEPNTESDAAALLIQLLTAFGNIVGRNAAFDTEGSYQYPNLFTVIVGGTSAGKGTSWGHIKGLLTGVSEDWAAKRLKGGLSSGEGLIQAVCDSGIASNNDKRLLVFESEFVSVLEMNKRDGNILSAVIRNLWDDGTASTLTKKDPLSTTDAHVSIIGHITPEELKECIGKSELYNGYANRFLWACVRSSKTLPDGGRLTADAALRFTRQLSDAIAFAQTVRELRRDDEARNLWNEAYPKLREERTGIFGKVTARARVQVVRLSTIFALLEQSREVKRVHLEAALAVWKYCEDSARFIFGDSTGNRMADRIFRALRGSGATGLTRTEISRDVLGGNVKQWDFEDALNLLLNFNLAFYEYEGSGREKKQRWFAKSAVNSKKYEKDESDEVNGLRLAA